MHIYGITHTAISSDVLVLDTGFVPRIIGLEASACIDYDDRFKERAYKPELQDRRYISRHRLKAFNKGETINSYPDGVKMDLYAVGALMLEAFFHPIVKAKDGTYPEAEEIDWSLFKDGYGLDERERRELVNVIKGLLNSDNQKPSSFDAEKAFSSALFQSLHQVDIKETTLTFITQLMFTQQQKPPAA